MQGCPPANGLCLEVGAVVQQGCYHGRFAGARCSMQRGQAVASPHFDVGTTIRQHRDDSRFRAGYRREVQRGNAVDVPRFDVGPAVQRDTNDLGGGLAPKLLAKPDGLSRNFGTRGGR